MSDRDFLTRALGDAIRSIRQEVVEAPWFGKAFGLDDKAGQAPGANMNIWQTPDVTMSVTHNDHRGYQGNRSDMEPPAPSARDIGIDR